MLTYMQSLLDMQSPMNKLDPIQRFQESCPIPTPPPPLTEQGNRKGDQDHISKNALVMTKLTRCIFSLSTVSVLIMYPLSPPIKTTASEDTRCAVDSLMMDQPLRRSNGNRSIQETRLIIYQMMSVRKKKSR